MSRKAAREQLFKLAFEAEMKEVTLESLLSSFIDRVREDMLEKYYFEKETLKKEESSYEEMVAKLEEKLQGRLESFNSSLEFLKDYALGIDKHTAEILELISNKMEGWSYERIGNIEKVILKTSIFELSFRDTPKEVVINENIELAKKYGDVKSFEFINGVLAKFV